MIKNSENWRKYKSIINFRHWAVLAVFNSSKIYSTSGFDLPSAHTAPCDNLLASICYCYLKRKGLREPSSSSLYILNLLSISYMLTRCLFLTLRGYLRGSFSDSHLTLHLTICAAIV